MPKLGVREVVARVHAIDSSADVGAQFAALVALLARAGFSLVATERPDSGIDGRSRRAGARERRQSG